MALNIEPRQMKKIYAIGHALNLSASGMDDELHLVVSGVTGKDSISSLTRLEAENVIKRLTEMQAGAYKPEWRRKTQSYKPKTSDRKKEPKTVPGMATYGQIKKIWALMYELKKYDEAENDVTLGKRLCLIIKKEFGMDAFEKDPFKWLSFTQGNNLIEKLKGYIGSAKKKTAV